MLVRLGPDVLRIDVSRVLHRLVVLWMLLPLAARKAARRQPSLIRHRGVRNRPTRLEMSYADEVRSRRVAVVVSITVAVLVGLDSWLSNTLPVPARGTEKSL